MVNTTEYILYISSVVNAQVANKITQKCNETCQIGLDFDITYNCLAIF